MRRTTGAKHGLRLVLESAHFRRVRTLWSAEVVTVAALVASGLVIARALGPTTYGRFALLSAFGALVYTFIEPRIGEVVTKYVGTAAAQGRSRDVRAVLRGAIVLDVLAVVVAIALTTAAQPLAQGIASGTALDFALAAGATALSGPILTGRALLAVLDRYRDFARVQTVAGLLRAAATSAAASVTGDVTAVLAALVAIALLELAANLVVAGSAVRARHGRRPDEDRTRLGEFARAAPGVGRFIAYSEATTLLGSLTKFADTLIVGAVAGAEQAGLYRLARSLTAPVATIVTPLQTVTYNRLVAVHLEGGAPSVRTVGRRATLAALPLALMVVAATPLVPTGVRLLAGESFSAAGPVAVALLLGAAVGLPAYWLRLAYLVLERLRTWLVVSVGISVVSMVAFVGAALLEGALGVAVARGVIITLIGNLILLSLLKTRRRHERGDAATSSAAHPF